VPGTGVGTALFGWTSLPWLWAIGHRTLVIAGDDPVTPPGESPDHRLADAMGNAAYGTGDG